MMVLEGVVRRGRGFFWGGGGLITVWGWDIFEEAVGREDGVG